MWNPFRRRTERRAITDVPWDVGGPSTISVNQSRALGLTAVFAANRHIVDNVSTLPLQPFRKVGDARQPMGSLPQLFKRLDDAGRLGDWQAIALSSLVIHGNTVGVILERDGLGFPVEILWLPMNEVHVDDSFWPRVSVWYWRGRRLDPAELCHIPWIKVAGRTLGLSPIEHYALTISNGIQAQQYGNDWFAAGGIPPGKMKNSAKKVDQTEADAIKARLVASIRSRKPLVYGADWDYQPIVIPPEQAQFIETMKLTANQVAAIYGIDPTEIGGEAANSQEYANEEFRQTRRMQDLRPWMVRLERSFSAWLPENQHVRFNADAVIRADTKSRHEVYKLQREIGMANVDEIRAREDQQPLPDGKGQDYTPLSRTATAPAVEPRPDPTRNGRDPVPANT
jgi:HK97 family phage portal protein